MNDDKRQAAASTVQKVERSSDGRRWRDEAADSSRQLDESVGNSGAWRGNRGRGGYSRGRGKAFWKHERGVHGGENCGDGRMNSEDPRGPREERNKDPPFARAPFYKRLVEWTQKGPSEVVAIIANTHNGFSVLLEGDLKPDIMILVVKILAIACKADFQANKASILSSICGPSGQFLTKLNTHMSLMGTETDPKRKASVKDFFEDVLLFCETVVNVLPSTACEYLGGTLTFVTVAMTNVTTFHDVTFDEALGKKIARLQAQIKEHLENRAKKQIKETSANESVKYQPPPDDFRDLSVFPTSEDLMSREKAFVRPNIIKGAYLDVDHYLDVQFRLLREDFVCPLREGIMNYITMNEGNVNKKINNIRIYKGVQFKGVKVVNDSVGLVVNFESSKKINWEQSKRFIFGALLCFTNDNFESILFATVLDRNVKDLAKGQVVVELDHHSPILNNMFNIDYVMVESEVFFMPYQHVLIALQKMNNAHFPMSQYIVSVQAHTQPPQYVLDHREFAFTIGDFQVPVLDDTSWPTAEALGLDESQCQAFKSALTKEFVVIQGPPGTGKTYLGLKIARTLLASVNRLLEDLEDKQEEREWLARYRTELQGLDGRPALPMRVNTCRTPILVVCFTNHALDQFLEGLLDTTDNIVRVGGQSRSERLEQHNLREKRKSHRNRNDATLLMSDLHRRMSTLMSKIKCFQRDMEQLQLHAGIITLDCIGNVYPHPNLNVFKNFRGVLDNALLLEWLDAGEVTYDHLDDYGREDAYHLLDNPQEGQGADHDSRDERVGDDFDLDQGFLEIQNVTYAMSFLQVSERVREIRSILSNISRLDTYVNPWLLHEELNEYLCRMPYYKNRLCHPPHMNVDHVNRLAQGFMNLYGLSADERWALYHHWLRLLGLNYETELRHLQLEYRGQARQYSESRDMEDLALMRYADVVGMTTTMAAKSQPLLQALKPRIVIVEEAAEVMESHIVVSLTNYCQHLILIGDHQQLRPTTAVYKLARDFNFDISLFERMLRNGLHCEVIEVQHRMRPEIARLIVPSIYDRLVNHESVKSFEPIRGVTKNVFFLTHANAEESVGETNSRRNTIEGDMLLAFCRHLLLQGYGPECITILTTYSGQMFYLRSERKKYPILEGVQITIVDNYQGEENDIILLSLVRNNAESNIGFLKTANRVCVALSRAKHGFFIMGNMNNLTASSTIWPKIKEALDEQNAVGDCLTLRCEIHPEQLTKVKTANDFHKVPEGGCQLLCGAKLLCGHHCKSVCHVSDRDHLDHLCFESCARIPKKCNLDHPCRKLCHETCGDCPVAVERALPCGHVVNLPCHVDHLTYGCMQVVDTTEAACGHAFTKPCSVDKPCPLPCENRLDCGHACTRKCHATDDPDHVQFKCQMDCTKKNVACSSNHMCARKCFEDCSVCVFEVQKSPAHCDHVYRVECWFRPEDIICYKPCKKTLPCTHPCRLPCSEPCGKCDVKVDKVVEACGHTVRIRCSETAERRHCHGSCPRVMACGHKCQRACKVECSTPEDCTKLVDSLVTPACGHKIQVECHFNEKGPLPNAIKLLGYCKEKCSQVLKCGHQCLGDCGTCIQGRIHQACREKCGKVLVCGHTCNEPCSESCPPCKKKCRYSCKHSKCAKTCGFPCFSCAMKCDWRCEHKSCTKLCGQACNRGPCYEPCKKKLPCKHPCVGFCGEPCPPLCRICDEKQITTIFFGNEDEPDARFVYLVDCKHSMESGGLETWLRGQRSEVTMLQCPLCKTDIMRTQRFMNEVREVFKDVQAVKSKVFGEKRAIESGRDDVYEALQKIKYVKKGSATLERPLVRSRTVESKRSGATQVPASSGTVQLPTRSRFNLENAIPLTEAGFKLLENLSSALRVQRHKRGAKTNHSWIDVETLGIQVKFFAEIQSVYDSVYSELSLPLRAALGEHTDLLLSTLMHRDRISAQEVEDFNTELKRYQRVAQFCQLESRMKTSGLPTLDAQQSCDAAQAVLFSIEKYTDAHDTVVKENFDKLKKTYALSEIELRKQIIKAVGLKQGHWYKCPNGHFYAIGECGGAMVVSKCPDCGVPIGGTGHRLLADNQVATEMDGATMGAWDRATAGVRAFL